MIAAEDLHFAYGRGRPVLRGVSFEAAPGELLAVIGPNGSGKSTLIKLLDGLLEPGSGRVLLGARDLAGYTRREVARAIGYVAQSADLHFPLTALEYVLQGRFAHGHVIGFETDLDLDAAHTAMSLTGTSALADRHVGELSGGERQRCMLARALAQEPRVLLLDEPTANLDISHQVRTLDLVRRLAHRDGLAAVVVSHELNLAAEFADRVLLLGRGEVRALGTPRDVLTAERVGELFGTPVLVDRSPTSGAPRITVVAPRAPGAGGWVLGSGEDRAVSVSDAQHPAPDTRHPAPDQ
jgi:iron complex transport system ATP-binding protein